MKLPPNVEVVNGHWLCFESDGKVSLYTPGEGFWGFWLPEPDARMTAQTVHGGVCIECGCAIERHTNEADCDQCKSCDGLMTKHARAAG